MENKYKSEVKGLIEVLLNKNVDEASRDDAAMDLSEYNDDFALDALLLIAKDPADNHWVRDSCGESIAMLWMKRNIFNLKIYNSLCRDAQTSLHDTIQSLKPEWKEKYQIPDPQKQVD